MGKSNPFPCDFTPSNDPASYMAQLFPKRLVAQCRQKSLANHDLAAYHTNASVDDLNDLRAALGYRTMVLSGGSYGTFFSLVYLRRHPDTVASMVLDAVDPPGFQVVPGEPMGAQKALDDLFTKCRTNARCGARYPHFPQEFRSVLARFDRGPVIVPAENVLTKRTVRVALTKDVLVDQIRHLLYDPFPASYLPYAIHRAYAGNYMPLSQMVQAAAVLLVGDLNQGAFLSYSCSDWMPFISPAALAYARAHSFAGDLRVRAQQIACKTWGVPAMPASFNEPVRSAKPVLMLLGSDDPGTPPQYGQKALKYLPNGRAVLIKGAAHGADNDCTDNLVVQFVRNGSAKSLNVNKCTATFALPPFATSMKGWPSL